MGRVLAGSCPWPSNWADNMAGIIEPGDAEEKPFGRIRSGWEIRQMGAGIGGGKEYRGKED